VGVGFREAGSFVQNRITGAFDGIRERFKDLTAIEFVQIEGRGMREPATAAMTELLRGCKGEHTLVAAATIPARWACWMRCARRARRRTSPSWARIAFPK
jgi:hypothetical protein